MGFKPGKSGNPRGRPAGARNKASLLLDKLMQGGAEEIMNTIIDRAKGGDMSAARLVLERLVPPAKERPVAIKLPDASTAKGLLDAQELIIASVASGGLLPGEGEALMRMLDNQRKTIETADFEERLRKIEEQLEDNNYDRQNI
jgi:hypothetical protein